VPPFQASGLGSQPVGRTVSRSPAGGPATADALPAGALDAIRVEGPPPAPWRQERCAALAWQGWRPVISRCRLQMFRYLQATLAIAAQP
jgi:hypothetical protein